ncbi:MAG: Fic family protein [Coriobacteriales bacterium]|jgi:Fic family protein|nr:Fic family protein [Coriobacteriales bacterium]
MRKYIYQYDSWPKFTWDTATLAQALSDCRLLQGRVLGRLDALGFSLRESTTVAALTNEIVTSSEIEGERLDAEKVRSSIAQRLGVKTAGLSASGKGGPASAHDVEGVVELMLDATRNFAQPLTAQRLFGWHAALFPTGYSGLRSIVVAGWREGEMQVVSGPIGKESVHYEAPPPELIPAEMNRFLEWFNGDARIDPLLKAGLAHFWFVIIYPFDDGNGRLARALTEMLLARSDGSADRYYSMSAAMLAQRKGYYASLNSAQFSSGDVTEWLLWFVSCLSQALHTSMMALNAVENRAEFWSRHAGVELNLRQQKVIGLLLEDFAGKLTTSKWARLTKVSHDTALRDIKDLIAQGILEQEPGGGRNTSFRLK